MYSYIRFRSNRQSVKQLHTVYCPHSVKCHVWIPLVPKLNVLALICSMCRNVVCCLASELLGEYSAVSVGLICILCYMHVQIHAHLNLW